MSASVLARRRPSGRNAANSPLSSQSLQGLHKASLGNGGPTVSALRYANKLVAKQPCAAPFGLVWFLRYTNFPRRYLALRPHRFLGLLAKVAKGVSTNWQPMWS